MAQAARRVSKSAVDWTAFAQKVPSREQEVYRALKNRSDYFVNKVHSNPESLSKINFDHYKSALPGLKMVGEFEAAYSKVEVPYPVDSEKVADQIKADRAKAMSESDKLVKQLEHEKSLSALYLRKLDELPPLDKFTMEMEYDYFSWLNRTTHPQLYPADYAPAQPENLEYNDSKGLNWLLSKFKINVKV
ncbi:ATP synthase subunit d, mitochondrial-like [Watersipora subatra]|uniref:ATP synthase subunit d, mitochondrial-like n=1 Tax=Watersipora subatra TaxID=2589382 RepID=UPI00355BB46D